ncbi:hypothetical protein FEM03_01945 [Phragmitibacter flavus]|uniref:site-specific DNA-methyltransferase (adenine-specific) n=1 Tax=Phragmitibacter flavus TaxID=2576071 RepID=A0A5R8KKS0_9BACT|nr:N-6 DNA methylase [Phragmitibacter flavus]TLD72857.1 hypothetical protein FEM03_01945 [Phragmitibacter flavus]
MSIRTLAQFESHFWEAPNIPRGSVDIKSDVFPLLFFKQYSDVHDDEHASRLEKFDGNQEAARFSEMTRCGRFLLTDEHLQRLVRAYKHFNDKPGYTRVVPLNEFRMEKEKLSIPLYVGGETQAQTEAATETATKTLPDALAGG